MTKNIGEQTPARRDFVLLTALGFVGMGAALAAWPFLAHMNPDASAASHAGIDVDVSSVQPGQTIVVSAQGSPVFIRRRTKPEIDAARAIGPDRLYDPLARNAALSATALATDANRTKEGHAEWIVVVGVCTHLSCVLTANAPSSVLADGEGWLCPCHNARFDHSGRVSRGPARTNLPVPAYRFTSPSTIRIGWVAPGHG